MRRHFEIPVYLWRFNDFGQNHYSVRMLQLSQGRARSTVPLPFQISARWHRHAVTYSF